MRDDDNLSLYGSDISLPRPLHIEEAGQATSFEIPILHSEPTSEQPYELPSDFGFTSYGNNSGGGNSNGSGNGNGNGNGNGSGQFVVVS